MSPTGNSGDAEDTSRHTLPDPEDLTKSVRGEIAHFFGGPTAKPPAAAPRDPVAYGRLLADLENKILGSLRQAEEPPAELGPFILEERIGRGGFAVVYRATHKRTGARAAVKVVPASDAESNQRIATEVESLIRLRHPNIVRVIDTGENDGFAWIATDFIEGMTLADFIKRRSTPAESFYIGDDMPPQEAPVRSTPPPAPDAAAVHQAMSWFRDLAGALDALHSAGLVHRDVKPANILIDSTQRPFLIDFGLSSSAESTVDGILAGTVPYMSPEQTLGGYVAITPRSDLYSLAATFHEVLTGHRVTRGARRDTMLHQIAFVTVLPPSEVEPAIPASLDPIFVKALAKDSNQRYASARDLAEDLDRWLSNRTLVHVKEPRRRRVGRMIRRHPVGSAIAAVVVIALIAWGSISYLSHERDYQAVLRGISASVASDPLAALSTLAAENPRFGGRAEFQHLYHDAVLLGGEPLLRKMLKSQGFALIGLAERSTHTKLAREARQHLEATQTEEPNLILITALSERLSDRPAEARAILDRHRELVDRTRSLTELSAIVAIAEHDQAKFAAAMNRLQVLPPSELTMIELCLETWRNLFARKTEGFPKASPKDMERLEKDIDRRLELTADHSLARVLAGVIKFDRQDYHGARADFDELVTKAGDIADRAGVLFFHAVCGMLVAEEMPPNEKERTIATSVRYAREAIGAYPALLDLFSDEILGSNWDIRARWIRDVLSGPWMTHPPLGDRFLNFTAYTICDLSETHDSEVVISLCEAVEAEYGPRGGDPLFKADYLGIKRFEVTSHGKLAIEVEPRNMVEAKVHINAIREIVRKLRSKVDPLPYPMIASDALAAAFQAENEEEPGEKRRLVAEATDVLRNATDSGLLESAIKAVTEDAEKVEIREMGARCAEHLKMLGAK